MPEPRRAHRGAGDVAYADTNLFVALLAGPAHGLHEPALDIFRRVANGALRLIVTSVVVAELVYVTQSLLGWERGLAAARLGELIDADGLIVGEAAVLQRALALYGEISRLDFADAYLAAAALEVGPSAVASFDTDLDAVPGLRRIGA
jgi:predicted nucleic acid-binding protein